VDAVREGDDVTDQEYLDQLRENMADPAEAPWMVCLHCGRRFGVRAWPGMPDDHEVIAAMLDGLAELAAKTGAAIYGLYFLKDESGDPGEPDDLDAAVQLWRPGDDAPLVEGTQLEALHRINQHDCACPAWN
jgi:hypothetical protein